MAEPSNQQHMPNLMAEISENSLSEFLSNLPNHLIECILWHIQDVNSVGRYKCVSKAWRTFFSSHQFAKFHLQSHTHGPESILFIDDYNIKEGDDDPDDVPENSDKSGNEDDPDDVAEQSDNSGNEDDPDDVPEHSDSSGNEDEQDDQVVVKPFVKMHSPYVVTLGDNAVAKKLELPFLEGKSFEGLCPVQGSCHGLVLLSHEQGLLLVNPTTLDALEIPQYGEGFRYGFGLGYDSSTDDYKVVSIRIDVVDVYSVKNKTWRTVPNSSSFCDASSCSTRPFVNDRINFVSYTGTFSEVFHHIFVLAAFNVATEELESLPFPKGVDNFRLFKDRLMVLGGCLAMVVDRYASYDVWLMKEYGVQNSWTKFTINPDILCYNPLCFLDKDENELVSLEAFKRKFVAHNLKTGVSRDMVVKYMPVHMIWEGTGISFTKSLISPNYS